MAIRKNTKRIDPRYFLHETTIRDEIEVAINEVELAPAMYDALKAKGQLPPGTTRKAEPQAAAPAQPQGQQQSAAPAQPQGQQQDGADPPASANKMMFSYMKKLKALEQQLKDLGGQDPAKAQAIMKMMHAMKSRLQALKSAAEE